MKLYRVFLFFFICSACATSQKATYAVQSIAFGSGGGFAGTVTRYELLFDEKVLKKGGETLRTVEEEELQMIQALVLDHDLMNKTFNAPYNMYQFIELNAQGKVQNFVWGNSTQPPPVEVSELYAALVTLAKKK